MLYLRVKRKIKKLTKELVSTYVSHIEDKIDSGALLYVSTGLDDSYEAYGALFSEVLLYLLGLEGYKGKFPIVLVEECACLLRDSVQLDTSYKRVTTKYPKGIYDVCMTLYAMVVEDLAVARGNMS